MTTLEVTVNPLGSNERDHMGAYRHRCTRPRTALYMPRRLGRRNVFLLKTRVALATNATRKAALETFEELGTGYVWHNVPEAMS